MNSALGRLDLDFRGSRAATPWHAWLLLVLAAGFITDLGVSWHNAQEAVTTAQARLAKAERRDGAGPARASARNVFPEEIALARETYERLAAPWNDLFRALESTPADNVTLTAIEPDTKAGTVVISGEAPEYGTVLAYVAALQRANGLNRVHLVRHDFRQGERSRAAAFSVSASWSKAR